MLEYRPLVGCELEAGMRLVLEASGSGLDVERQVEALRDYAAAVGLRLDWQWGAFRDGRLESACLATVSPGRSAMLFLPGTGRAAAADVLVPLLVRILRDAGTQDVRLVQAMVGAGRFAEEHALRAAGFEFLAELVYMRRDADALMPVPVVAEGLSWTTYGPDRHDLFARTIAGTYQQSLDCPRLTGLRRIDDIIAGHQAAGEFDPQRWYVLHAGGSPAGVLLLARVPRRAVMEVVYMGLLPEQRGRGYGRVLLHRAICTARGAGCVELSLAADAANAPAMRLYRSCGFVETARRRAWIAIPPTPAS